MATRTFLAAAALLAGAVCATPALAESCWDLWYARNLIYAENGYCFSTDLGQRTFGNYQCWTKNPQLSAIERSRVQRIKAEEKRRGCKVN